MTNSKNNPIFLLIGIHRSGTSVLAQMLSLMGLDLGRSLMLPSYDNPRGFWENEKIVGAHDQLLHDLGRDWTTAGFLEEDWLSSEAADVAIADIMRILEADFLSDSATLIKDPRLAALYPLWKIIAGKLKRPLKVIGIVRSPDQVSRSLIKRNGFDGETAESIVLSYLERLPQIFSKSRAKIICYENMVSCSGEEIVERLESIISPFGSFSGAPIINTINRLIYNPRNSSGINAELQDLYDTLIGTEKFFVTARKLSNFTDKALLNSPLEKLKTSPARQHSLLPNTQEESTDRLARLLELKFELFESKETGKQARLQVEERDRLLGALRGGIAERDQQLADLRRELEAKETNVSKINQEIQDKNTQLGALQGGIVERDLQLADLRGELEQKEKDALKSQPGTEALRESLAELNLKLEEARHEFDGQSQKLSTLNAKLLERDVFLANMYQDAELKDMRLAQFAKTTIQNDGLIAQLRDDLVHRDANISDLSNRLALTQADMSELKWKTDQYKSQTDQRAIDLSAEIVRLRAREQDLEADLLARGRHIAETDQRATDLSAEIVRLQAREQDLEADLLARGRHIAETDQRATDLSAEIVRLQAREQDLEADMLARAGHIQHLDQILYEANEAKGNLVIAHAEMSRSHEALNVTHNLERARSAMIEAQQRDKLDILSNRLAYFQNHPIRAAVKKTVFSSLRFFKRALPLPASAQLALSRKATGLSQRLNPPQLTADVNAMTMHQPVDAALIDFAFPDVDAPVISIIVPVYNEISQTIACLRSIYQQSVSVPYEVIIADDTSPDPFHTALQDVRGARCFRNPENLGFLMNCNTNAEHARGEFIVFLNNDTLVNPGWLETLYQTFNQHKDVGIAGSKLVFPTGELQEAGGIIWEDASGWNWGRGQNADHPLYNFVRDVDYVSGASFMIRTDLFREIGGFYTGLEKAYYEDTDCCFRVREKGYRVLYQPHSSVIHIEGLSSGTDVTAGAKKYQLVNQKIFHETWKHVLDHHLPNAQTPEIASDRTVKGHVLYVDATTPEPDQDSGSVDAVNAMSIIQSLGYRVHFIPGTNFAYMGEATKRLQSMGIECIYHPFYSNMAAFLKDRGDVFDYIVLSRAEVNDLFLKQVKKSCPSAKIIYNTVDLHFLRQEREASLSGSEEGKAAALAMREKELGFMRAADGVIILSEHERTVLNDIDDVRDKNFIIPLIRKEAARSATYAGTKDIVFIGGYNHPPNVDAVEWLMNDIWPLISARLPGVNLRICGSAMPASFQDYASENVIIEGFIPDLARLLSKARLTIAPLRYGAGLKGKVASSIGLGVPCVGTPIAFEGMATTNLEQVKLEASTPEEFANLINEVYTNEQRWNSISVAGNRYHNDNYGKQAVSKLYEQLFERLRN